MFMHGSLSLIDGCVFTREAGSSLCMEPGVEVLEWEKGKRKGKKAKGGEKGGKKGRGEVKMCSTKRGENDKKRDLSKKIGFMR